MSSLAKPCSAAKEVLIVDDDPGLLELLSMRLEASGYAVRTATSGQLALTAIHQKIPKVVVTDLKMDDMDGMSLLMNIQKHWPMLPVIMLTAHGSIPDAIAATRKGVFAFLTKPVQKDELISTLESAMADDLAKDADSHWSEKIITRSSAMFRVLEQARLVADSDVNVLVVGDSGTGKELLAEAIHQVSTRKKKPFIAVNCGAIPQELMEAELFGYRKGAFTGAVADHAGLFSAANGGTLFLDEIGDMPLHLQVKLLRVLQERQIRPLGSSVSEPVDVRIVSATHRNLETMVEEGQFREDLYYRLNVVNLGLPALRDRCEDVPLLVEHFLKRIAERTKKEKKRFASDAMELLLRYSWPGNIRQLNNMVEQAVALTSSVVISKEVVQFNLPKSDIQIESLTEAKKAFERDYCLRILNIAGGNIPEAARLAGRNRSDFYKIVKKHGLGVD
ncbi:MAG: two-component system response regulator GlrR [Gammaproteobacteria bacterium]|nr:MAG: two-component system response regulator GlrR [Gammaproteobacteria bacterium]